MVTSVRSNPVSVVTPPEHLPTLVAIVGSDLGRFAALATLLTDTFALRTVRGHRLAAQEIAEARPDVVLADEREPDPADELFHTVLHDHLDGGGAVVVDVDEPAPGRLTAYRHRGCRLMLQRDPVDVATAVLDQVPGVVPSRLLTGVHNEHLRRIVGFVAARHRESPTIDRLATVTGLSGTYVSHLFKDRTGITVKEFVRRVHLESAKFLLSGSRATLDHVADRSGFADASHLSRSFRRYVGCTPAEHRR